MVELRTAPLADHAQYFLDCAVESYELDSCSHFILRLYGRDEEIAPLLVTPRQFHVINPEALLAPVTDLPGVIARHQANLRERRAICAKMVDLADATLLRLPQDEAGGLAYQGLIEIPHRITDLAQIIAGWTVNDETVGGFLKDFRKVHRVNLDDDPTPRLARRLASPRYVRNVVRNSTESAEMRTLAERSMARAAMVPREHLRSRYGAIQKLLRQQMEEERAREWQRLTTKERPPLDVPKRRMLRRAASTAVSVVGAEAVSAFVRGEDVTLPGDNVTLVIARRGSLAAIGHSTVAVAVKDRDGEALGQLCVYFDKTPALDQLTAFALHMQAGLEAEIVGSANIISATEKGLGHPLFVRPKHAVAGLLDDARPMRMRSSWERDRARDDRHWARHGKVWVEKLSEHVLGPRRRWLAETIAAGRINAGGTEVAAL